MVRVQKRVFAFSASTERRVPGADVVSIPGAKRVIFLGGICSNPPDFTRPARLDGWMEVCMSSSIIVIGSAGIYFPLFARCISLGNLMPATMHAIDPSSYYHGQNPTYPLPPPKQLHRRLISLSDAYRIQACLATLCMSLFKVGLRNIISTPCLSVLGRSWPAPLYRLAPQHSSTPATLA
ncbi:hypothetical protein F5B21DRAFT_474300 [Xylaria acuta]|nr:hypothetical protein F5B21DRAFT_474300 [Xylaria acuta]